MLALKTAIGITFVAWLSQVIWILQATHTVEVKYSGPCHLRPLHLTIPSILRPAISDNIAIFLI